MNKLTAVTMVTAFLVANAFAAGLNAQERTAGSTLETQMTWTTLSAQAKAASDKADAVNAKVNQAIACGQKGMIYAAGGNGVDSQGCKEAAKSGDLSVNISTLSSSLATTNNNVSNINNTVNSIINCNKSGLVFNGSGCIAPTSPVPTGTVCGASSNSTEVGRPLVFACQGHDPKSSCPAGYSGATVPIWGGKNGQSISYCFKN